MRDLRKVNRADETYAGAGNQMLIRVPAAWKASATYLITHASDNRAVPVGRETCHRFQGEGAGWPNECDHVVPEMHVRS